MFHVTFLFAYWAGIRSQDVTRVAFNAKRKLADIKLSTCNRITQVGWRTAFSWAGERRFLRLVAAWCERSLFRFESRDFLSVFVQLIQKLSYVRSGFKSLWSLKVNPFYLFIPVFSLSGPRLLLELPPPLSRIRICFVVLVQEHLFNAMPICWCKCRNCCEKH